MAAAADECVALPRGQVEQADLAVVRDAVGGSNRVEHGSIAGQHRGEPVILLPARAVRLRQHLWFATAGRDSEQPGGQIVGGEDDRVVAPPRRSTRRPEKSTECDCRSSRD